VAADVRRALPLVLAAGDVVRECLDLDFITVGFG
jgi:hypothetical protein